MGRSNTISAPLANPTQNMTPYSGAVPDIPYTGISKVTSPTSTEAREFIAEFLVHLTDWEFSPPSDNIWTLEIGKRIKGTNINLSSSNDGFGNGELKSFYKNVLSEGEEKKSVNDYFEKFYNSNTGSCFLVQGINIPFDSASVRTTEAIQYMLNQIGGLKFGKTVNGFGNHDLKANIQFLSSNLDINDWLIDPWIKAVAKYGLIKDDTIPDVTRDIRLVQWCSSPPNSKPVTLSDKENLIKCKSTDLLNAVHVWRKRYILYDAVPTSRSEVKHDYEYNNAGVFKISTVNFAFHDYDIIYNENEIFQ